MSYRIAGIDVHKKMLAVVVADAGVEGEYHFDRLKVGTSPAQLRALAGECQEFCVWGIMRSQYAPYPEIREAAA